MNALNIILTILQVLSGLAVTVIVLAQSGKSAGLSGSISGGAETFLSKGKAKTLDAKLAKLTKWFALGFVVLTLALNLLVKHVDASASVNVSEPAAVTDTVPESGN
ncbi:MAG: preprotein translocase subunit SecG [Oscillospiraceae bacterium]|nr:preprotein translocase subunit SecG [Oscillospiraceae bacterium]